MSITLYNISQVLGITIIHSLWQGLIIYMLLRAIIAGLPSLSAVKRYDLAVMSMMANFGWFAYTLVSEMTNYNRASVQPVRVSPQLPYLHFVAGAAPRPAFYHAIAGYLPYVCAVYFAGLTIKLMALGLEWNKIRLIKRSLIPAGQMQQYIDKFSKKLNIQQHIQLKFSDLIDVPCVTGYFKPLILLPVAIATNLTACEVESIILHELSHIKRNDHLMNLLQQVIKVMLFFNPFIQLINRIIDRERENGCDDLVIEKTGKPLIYAKALLKLEESRKANLQLALAATNNKFQLLKRIERIMNTKKQTVNIRHFAVAILLLAGSISCIAWLNPKIAANNKIKANVTAGIADGHIAVASELTGKVNLPAASGPAIWHSTIDTTKRKQHVKPTESTDNEVIENEDDDLADTLVNFYQSPKWREQIEAIKKQGEEIQRKFNDPQWRAQADVMKKQGEEMRRKFNSAEWKAQMDAIKRQTSQIEKQFNVPQWKKQLLAMQAQGEQMSRKFNSQEWKKQMEDIRKQSDDIRKNIDNADWKKEMEDIRKQGEDLQKKFNSPEWRKQIDEIKKQAEEIKGTKWILKDPVNGIQIYGPDTSEPVKKDKKDTDQ